MVLGRILWLVFGSGVIIMLFFGAFVLQLQRARLSEQEMRIARDQAERASQAKSDFMSSMSHELRTPMNAILGFAQILDLDDEVPSKEDIKLSVSNILSSGQHLLRLIDEILDLSHIESGRLHLLIERVPLQPMLKETLRLVAPMTHGKGISIAEPVETDAVVLADEMRLKQIILNLLSNAVKYNNPNGSVALAVGKRQDGMVYLEVTDTGPGIAQEDFEALFSPFERLGNQKHTVEGTGIGLSITKNLIQAMDGTIEVESRVGVGSTFRITLPSASVEQYASAAPGNDQLAQSEPRSVQVSRVC